MKGTYSYPLLLTNGNPSDHPFSLLNTHSEAMDHDIEANGPLVLGIFRYPLPPVGEFKLPEGAENNNIPEHRPHQLLNPPPVSKLN